MQPIAFSLALTLWAMHADANEASTQLDTTAHFGLRAGSSQIEGYVDFIIPIWKQDNHHLFFNPRFLLADEGNNQINVGIGFRHLFDKRGILGANLFLDSRESNLSNRYQQIGAGLEWLSNHVDARINLYESLDDVELVNRFETSETQTNQQVSATRSSDIQTSRTGITRPTASGNTVSQRVQTNTTTTTTTNRTTTTRRITTNRTFEQFEGTLDGWDAEVGFKLPLQKGPEIRLFGGYYSYDNPFNSDNISGAKARIEVRSGPYLSFDAEFFEDSFDQNESGNDYFIGARLEVPLNGETSWKQIFGNLFGNPNRSLKNRLHRQMVMRDVRIHTQISDPQEDESLRSQTIVESTQTKTQVKTETESSIENEAIAENVFFVDADNAGTETGSVESPFDTIAEAVAAAPANATVFVCESGGGVCDLNGGGGTYNETTGVTLQSGQTLTSTIAGVGGSNSFTTQNRPNITNSAQATNTGVINTSMTGGNTINRLAITARNANNRHGVFNNQSGTVRVIDSNISATGNNGNAILNSNSSGPITISSNTLTTSGNNGDGVENNATTGNILVTNNTFTGNGSNTRGVFNLNTVGTVTVSNNNVSTNGNNAEGIQNNNAQGAVLITNNTINTTGSNGTAILTNNSSSGSITARGNTIVTVDGDGIVSSGSSGAITTENNTVTTSGNNREGILNSNTTNNIIIAGNTVTTNGSNSEAIQNNNSTGNISVTGNTVMTNGTDAEGIFNNNNAATPAAGTSTTVSNNTITTNNTGADGIVNQRRVDVTVSNNAVTTNNDNAEGIRSNLNAGEIISENTVSTSGTGAEGILSTNITGPNSTITNNTISTNGNNSDGIETNAGATNMPTVSISGNTVVTQGNNAHALNTVNIANVATISTNTLNTNQTNAFGSRNRTNAGGAINVNGNVICVPAGGQHTNNGGAGTVNVGTNTELSQANCP
ncbi:MAG: right-handed parallel beta-helix repeat-containing protein [Arenicella sp.]